jgi:acyl carrier protein phosphodiesterase
MAYNTPPPVEYVITDGNNRITCQLNAMPQVKISGKVKDASTGLPLSGAVVSASQTFGGKYSKTLNAKTDGNGVFTLDIANVPTSVAFAASDYVSQIRSFSDNELHELNELEDVLLKSISGTTITLSFTYTSCDGETQNWYSDYQNVSYELFNVTHNKAVSQYNVQYPQIVLLEEVADGDVLRLTATSRTNAFMPVTTTATIAEQKAEATFDIVELGRIEAEYTQSGNVNVVASLYDANGRLLKTQDYSDGQIVTWGLANGQYTLVSMGSSRFFNSIYDLTQLPQTGLIRGTDYVQHTVTVKSGQVTTIKIDLVPKLDESKLYYTGDNTSFTVNKPSIVAGNYLTLTGRIDFKPAYATNVSNVQMIVDLPESCEFVENSVMVGNSTSSYTLNGNRITIPMARYTDRVRFCIIPTLGGEYAPSAFAQFTLNGKTVTQPIGSANYTAKDLSISVPSTVAKTSIPVSGTAIGTSHIEIYDNDVLIGQTTSMANGTWATTCELNEPYNLSTHSIYAKVTTNQGLELKSESVECIYDRNSVEVKKVTMINTAHPVSSLNTCEYVTVFDFQNPISNIPAYWYWPSYPDFTFLIDFTNNDSTVVSNVTLHVKLSNNSIARLKAIYDKSKDLWIVSNKFYSNALPKNVSVTYDTSGEAIVDRSEMDAKYKNIDDIKNYYVNLTNALNDSIAAIAIQESQYNKLLEKLDSISNSISQATDENREKELWEQYFMLTGHEELVDSMQADCPEVITPEYQQALFSRIDSLLSNEIISPSETEWNSFVQAVDELLDDNNNIIDFEASVATLYDTEYSWSDNDVERIMQRVPISEIDLTQFDEAELTSVNTSDGYQLLIGVNDRMMVWIDTSCDSAWVVKDNKLASEVRSINRRAKDNPEMLDVVIDDIKYVWGRLMDKVTLWSKEITKQFNNLQGEIDACEYYKNINNQRGLECQREIARIQKELNNMTRSVPAVEDNLTSYQRMLKERLEALRKSYQGFKKQAEEAAAKQAKLKIKWARLGAVLGTITDILNLGQNIQQLISQIIDGKQDWDRWCTFINTILPCEAAESQALSIKKASEGDRNVILAKYIGCGTATAAAIGGTIYLMANKAAGAVVKFVFGSISDLLSTYSKRFFSAIKKDSAQKLSSRKEERRKLKCNDNDDGGDDGNNGNGDGDSGNGDVGHVMDPSGYVYEGVTANRIEGVTATAYYKEMVEDMYGDLHENIVKWDASEYAQENPLYTDEAGMYAWDVPNGLWQVKFEKEGYETTYSEWLPVPPPQLDVNIAMKQNRQPEVKAARAFEDAVEVEFDKYMMSELLTTENIMVMQNGTVVEGSIELLNSEAATEGSEETFASKVRFNAGQPFTEQEVTLMVSNRVKSYAGTPMQDNYQQTFSIQQEIKQIVSDEQTVVGYGENATLTVSVLPASASKGKKLNVKTSSPMILGVETEQVTIGNDGQAEVLVSGELPGTAALTFSVEGTDRTAVTIANIYQTVATPTASISSGQTVGSGTQIALTSETVGATIYYTLDGSCPCDATARNLYDGPITVSSDVTIKAVAVKDGMADSEVATFTYTVVESVVLDENSTTAPTTAVNVEVLLKRTMREGGWNTICLPFTLSDAKVKELFGEDTKVCEFSNATTDVNGNMTLSFASTSSGMLKNTPYLMLPGENGNSYTIEGVTIDPASVSLTRGDVTFIGTYVGGNTVPVGDFYLSNNKFYESVGLSTIGGYRGYFHIDSSAGAHRLILSVDGTTTDIVNMKDDMNDEAPLYDLTGRRIKVPSEGIYIKKNRIVVINKNK